ncbi:hypothetical protein [Brevundimonas sp. FT23042]|uniref:hypothetical protein n=1 Tax=Brevundimonas sp. FT23042 TaxID=3393749 RepID=UPI003B589078
MFAALALGAALSVAALPQEAAAPARPPVVSTEDPIRLEDVVSNSRTLEEATQTFVQEVAAPVRRRGYARWHDGVCVGVSNLSPEAARFMVDRISDRARQLGLTAGEPGCDPSILVVATVDATPFTAEFVSRRPRLFRVGGSGMDHGAAAFRRFIETDRPVRWWSVSQPTDADTGQAAVRIPGEVRGSGVGDGSALQYAPNTAVRGVSRLNAQYRQDLKRTFVIIDVDRVNGASIAQLSDYVAMVSLAQIDPDADTSRFDTILNLFDDPGAIDGLTDWDNAYLDGLYESESYRINQASQINAIAQAIQWKYRDGIAEDESEN